MSLPDEEPETLKPNVPKPWTPETGEGGAWAEESKREGLLCGKGHEQSLAFGEEEGFRVYFGNASPKIEDSQGAWDHASCI